MKDVFECELKRKEREEREREKYTGLSFDEAKNSSKEKESKEIEEIKYENRTCQDLSMHLNSTVDAVEFIDSFSSRMHRRIVDWKRSSRRSRREKTSLPANALALQEKTTKTWRWRFFRLGNLTVIREYHACAHQGYQVQNRTVLCLDDGVDDTANRMKMFGRVFRR